jgi:hypothetical protein
MTYLLRTAMSLLVGLSLSSCRDSGVEPELMDGQFSARLVYGFVTGTDGQSVSNASVRLEARVVQGCSDLRDGTTVLTDDNGRYSAVLGNWGSAFDACVRVWATPSGLSALGRDSTSRASVRIGGDWNDSLRIDFVLPPVGAVLP